MTLNAVTFVLLAFALALGVLLLAFFVVYVLVGAVFDTVKWMRRRRSRA